jgi:hypothetical protein
VRPRQSVGDGAELGVQVEDARRHRPAELQEAAQFGGGGVGDEQAAGVDRERRPAG